MINDMGIPVHESAPDADALMLADADTDEAAAEEAAAALAAEVPFEKIVTLKEKEGIAQLKRVPDAEVEKKCGELMHSLERSLLAK